MRGKSRRERIASMSQAERLELTPLARKVRVVVVLLMLVGGSPLASSPSYADTQNEYIRCMKETKDQDACLERLGRHSWYPQKVDSCYIVQETLRLASEQGWKLSWKILFFNERCARLRMPHFVTPGAATN